METIEQRLEKQWASKKINIDWLAYESLVVDIMNSDENCGNKLCMLREALDAFTRRGHFIGRYENV